MCISISKLLVNKAGNTLTMLAVALVPLTVMVGSAVDMSISYMAQARLQNACDTAVLAGRQSMTGTGWEPSNKAEAKKFFDFNFPAGTNGVKDARFKIDQDKDDLSKLVASAEGEVPTAIMSIFGYDTLSIAASCGAKKDLGHNDVMMVLDVTGSMNYAPSKGGASKISRLRDGTSGLYRALQDDSEDSRTRFGIIPYSHTINIGTSIHPDYIKYNQSHTRKVNGRYVEEWFTFRQTKWKLNYKFQRSGDACIEERASVGNAAYPIKISDYVTQADIDTYGRTPALQFGRYDPQLQQGQNQNGCPSEVMRLREFDSEDSFRTAINNSTVRVTGGTYHDVGMLWGTRFLSRNGLEKHNNPFEVDGFPVQQHIVFMTDGALSVGDRLYSTYGVERYQKRTLGSRSQKARHSARFNSVCNMAKSMGMTIWVIAFDVTDVKDIKPCATSERHFYTTNGSDLEEVFSRIGQGIGDLRLTQ